jgi:hypothetical protein
VSAFRWGNAIAYGYRMAKKTTVVLVDDIDGGEIDDGKGETVFFALDGVSYEIDLSDSNASKLRDALKPFVDAGRRSARGTRSAFAPGRSPRSSSREDLGHVREWLRARGHKVSDRGRIPATLLEEYRSNS